MEKSFRDAGSNCLLSSLFMGGILVNGKREFLLGKYIAVVALGNAVCNYCVSS